MKTAFTIFLFSAMLVCGCQTVPTRRPATAARENIFEPCSARLHDIGGAILMYYALHRRMPPHLQDVAALADLDAPLQFTCPVSGRPYVYNSKGLAIAGSDKRIIVYDSTAAHDGQRRCLLMPPIKPGQAVSTDVQSIGESAFQVISAAGNF